MFSVTGGPLGLDTKESTIIIMYTSSRIRSTLSGQSPVKAVIPTTDQSVHSRVKIDQTYLTSVFQLGSSLGRSHFFSLETIVQ